MKDWSNFLEIKLSQFYSSGKLKHFKNLISNYQRVEFIITQSSDYLNEIEKFLNEIYSVDVNNEISDAKSTELSDNYRKKGNDCYSKKDNSNAFKFYTLAILYAQNSSNSLILGYSNRSAVFFDQKLFEQCLLDLNNLKTLLLASSIANQTENSSLVLKLLSREVNSLIELQRSAIDLDQNEFVKILRIYSLENVELNTKIDHLKRLIREKCPNRETKSLDTHKYEEVSNFICDSIDVKYAESKGRHCIANRDINPGECLFVEKAYCAIILPEFNLNYCQLCFKRIYDETSDRFFSLNIQPCDKCASVLYCSIECKNRAESSQDERESFHRYECGILKRLLHNLGIAHLSYRILISTNDDKLLEFSKYEMNNEIISLDQIKTNYKMADNDYEQIFNLLTHEKETHVDDLFKYSITSILLGKHFLNKSQTQNTLMQISCLILRHLLQTICNAHAITSLRDDTHVPETAETAERAPFVTYDREQIRFATAIYPRVSLLNHSCNSNVISSFKLNSSTIVVKAARLIEKSNEIYNSYGPHYLKMGLIERKQALLDQYRFNCDCDQCNSQLVGMKLSKDSSSLRCTKCLVDEVTIEIKSCISSFSLQCPNCKIEIEYQEYVTIFEKLNYELGQLDLNRSSIEVSRRNFHELSRMLNFYRRYLMINEKLELVNKCKRINNNFRFFYLDYSKICDCLARVSCNLKEFEKANDILECNVKLLASIYNMEVGDGSALKGTQFSIEFANELFKLAEIQCNCGYWSKALENVSKAISIGENCYSSDNQLISEFYELRKNILNVLKNV